MNIYATCILAFAMSMDAFAASIGKGASLERPGMREALRTGMIFGTVEAITPLIGWAAGFAASKYVMAWDHWIAFTLLAVLGGRMIRQGWSKPQNQALPVKHSFCVLVMTAIATSLDALAVGVGLSVLQVDIVTTALVIGLMTLVMASCGVLLGRFIGPAMGRWAEVLGGVVLVGIGCTILFEHLGLFSAP